MNIAEICLLLDKAKETSVEHLEYEGLKVDFSHEKIAFSNVTHATSGYVQPAHQSPIQFTPQDFDALKKNNLPFKEQAFEELIKPISPFEGLSEEEILYAATPYAQELADKKIAHQKKLDEEKNK